jgi:hypothetical protein
VSTTSLFIEILVIGTVADIWFTLIILAVFPLDSAMLLALADVVDKLSTFLVVPFLALTYILGWIVNFLSEVIIEPLFQARFKQKFFTGAKVNYGEVRALFYQEASEHVIEDFSFDRQILRISRTSSLNFLVLGGTVLLFVGYNRTAAIIGAIVSISIAVLAFLQWRAQYKLSYTKMLNTYRILLENSKSSEAQESVKAK